MKNSRKKIIVITSVVSVVLIVFTITSVLILRYFNSQAVTNCYKANTTYASAYKNYEQVKAQGDKLAKIVTSANMVADKQTYETFKKNLDTTITKATLLNCKISLAETFNVNTTRLDKATNDVQEFTKIYEKSQVNVKTSFEKKQLDDAITQLNTKLNEANDLYTQSNGKVADQNTRNTLKQLIDTTQNQLKNKNLKLDDMKKSMDNLSQSMNSVNESIQAKTKAEQEAQARARAQTRRSYQPTNNNRQNTNTPNQTNQKSADPDSPNFDWDTWVKSIPPAPCEAEHTCQYALG